MILVTGGLGFLGSNIAQALLAVGEDCVLTQHHNDRVPAFLKHYLGKRIFIEPLDVSNTQALLQLGQKYRITGIVHLATGGMPPAPGANALELVKDVQATVTSIAGVFEAAHEWNVMRILLASAPVVYNGVAGLPWRDDLPLPMTAAFSMEVAKKCGEIVSSYLALQTHVESVEMRFAAMYGPNYNATRSSLVGRLVHAAVKGAKPNLEGIRFGSVYSEDGGDQCYVKDAARAVALLQTADKLSQRVYNVSSGYPTANQAIVDAIKKVIPTFEVDLPAGHMPGGMEAPWYFDIASLCEDTGFAPRFDVEAGIADYIAWLRAGNAE